MAILQSFLAIFLPSRYILHYIFHKTEIQTVILSWWMGLNLIGPKDMVQIKTRKTAKNTKITENITPVWFFYKLLKNENENICILCHNYWSYS